MKRYLIVATLTLLNLACGGGNSGYNIPNTGVGAASDTPSNASATADSIQNNDAAAAKKKAAKFLQGLNAPDSPEGIVALRQAVKDAFAENGLDVSIDCYSSVSSSECHLGLQKLLIAAQKANVKNKAIRMIFIGNADVNADLVYQALQVKNTDMPEDMMTLMSAQLDRDTALVVSISKVRDQLDQLASKVRDRFRNAGIDTGVYCADSIPADECATGLLSLEKLPNISSLKDKPFRLIYIDDANKEMDLTYFSVRLRYNQTPQQLQDQLAQQKSNQDPEVATKLEMDKKNEEFETYIKAKFAKFDLDMIVGCYNFITPQQCHTGLGNVNMVADDPRSLIGKSFKMIMIGDKTSDSDPEFHAVGEQYNTNAKAMLAHLQAQH